MANILGRTFLRSTRALRQSGVNAGERSGEESETVRKGVLQKGARRDPELYVCA